MEGRNEYKEALATIKTRDDGDLNSSSDSGYSEKQMASRHIQKVESTGHALLHKLPFP